jgi:GrpB-like predicted nucleotidyltransferase (UPF0157 family)/RimJ/RimL family protein N-acetyltransferase/ribosomal protein S18 acetylase RimI-like enzyme
MNELLTRPRIIQTNRLILRPIRKDDAPDTVRILTNPRCAETYMLPDYPSPDDALPLARRLAALSEKTGAEDKLVYGIALREDDRLIGFLNEVAREGDAMELGYVLHPNHWNRGYMTEAFREVIGMLFRCGYSAVRAGYFEENAASRRVMEKCGMTLTGESEEIDYRGRSHRCVYREIRKIGRMGKAVSVVPYSSRWKEDFALLRDRIAGAAGSCFSAVEHVGSTSVEGLCAKPIVDIDAVLADAGLFPAAKDALAGIGYEYEGDRGIPGREAFRYVGGEILPKHNLYVCPPDSPELARHLALRNWLREHPAGAEAYGRIKQRAAEDFPYEIERYIEAKTPFIESVYREAGLLPSPVRQAREEDAERIAEIRVGCYRMNFYPIFRSDSYYFGELSVTGLARRIREDPLFPGAYAVFDDGAVKGYSRIEGDELKELFVEPCLQGRGIGTALFGMAVRERGVRTLWALEENTRALRFYSRRGFTPDGERKPEADTEHDLIRLSKTEA